MGIITFIIVLTLVIGIHEGGHYLAARLYGVKVDTFAIGFGSTLFSRTNKHGTEFALKAIPLGGYVSMDEKHVEDLPAGKRIVISLAGPAANIIPLVILALIVLGPDKLWAITQFLGWAYAVTIQSVVELALWPFTTLLGITPDSVNDVVGPIGIADVAYQETNENGMMKTGIVLFLAMSIGVGLFNLMPIPPLDGGHVLLAGIEKVYGKEASEKIRTRLATIGTLLVLWVIFWLIVKDVASL